MGAAALEAAAKRAEVATWIAGVVRLGVRLGAAARSW
jgi:hypothetical protein